MILRIFFRLFLCRVADIFIGGVARTGFKGGIRVGGVTVLKYGIFTIVIGIGVFLRSRWKTDIWFDGLAFLVALVFNRMKFGIETVLFISLFYFFTSLVGYKWSSSSNVFGRREVWTEFFFPSRIDW